MCRFRYCLRCGLGARLCSEEKANILGMVSRCVSTLDGESIRSWSVAAAQNQTGEHLRMDEGRKRVLAIVAGILVARHLKTPEDLGDSRPSPRTEYLISSAVQWADRIMRRIDGVFGNSPGNG